MLAFAIAAECRHRAGLRHLSGVAGRRDRILRSRSRTLGAASFGGRRAGRLQRVLVGAEMALATALLVSAGLLLQSFAHLMRADRGYAIDNVITADLSLFGDRYAESARRIAFYRDLADRIRALAGVSAAGMISDLPAVASSTGASRTILLPTDPLFEQVVIGAAHRRDPQRHLGILRRKRDRAQGRPVPRRRGSGDGGASSANRWRDACGPPRSRRRPWAGRSGRGTRNRRSSRSSASCRTRDPAPLIGSRCRSSTAPTRNGRAAR